MAGFSVGNTFWPDDAHKLARMNEHTHARTHAHKGGNRGPGGEPTKNTKTNKKRKGSVIHPPGEVSAGVNNFTCLNYL